MATLSVADGLKQCCLGIQRSLQGCFAVLCRVALSPRKLRLPGLGLDSNYFSHSLCERYDHGQTVASYPDYGGYWVDSVWWIDLSAVKMTAHAYYASWPMMSPSMLTSPYSFPYSSHSFSLLSPWLKAAGLLLEAPYRHAAYLTNLKWRLSSYCGWLHCLRRSTCFYQA